MIILIHTSKTMRPPVTGGGNLQIPELMAKASMLAGYLKTISAKQVASTMSLSPKLADTTHGLIAGWTDQAGQQRAAIDSFLGDIYSGLQVHTWTQQDREYANDNLRILSGLYGILRPHDGIYPYRLEMGYKLPFKQFQNLYNFWGNNVTDTLPNCATIINLAALEYSKIVTKYIDKSRIITPSFLTISPKTRQPTFVAVHAKIARGAFASWLIKNRITDVKQLKDFCDIGYIYSQKLSTPAVPVFVCQKFAGLGLSIRLK